MSFAPVFRYLGWLLACFAVAMLAPAAVALGYGETNGAAVFAATAAVTLFVGIGIVFATQGAEKRVRRYGSFLLVVAAWPLLTLFAAAPFYILGAVDTVTEAFFEACSGLTTSGATLMSNLDGQERSIVFWRAWLQWLGGLGTIVLAVSVLPMLGIGGMQAFHSALPHGDQATFEARTMRSAASLSTIYAGLTLACAAALSAAGTSTFDAFGLALSTVSTGGFSTRDAALGTFDSPLVEWVLIVFMLAGALNFTLYWSLVRGRPKVLRDDLESRALIVVAALVGLGAAHALAQQGTIVGSEALRHGAFAAVSALTTTGFVHRPAEYWPSALPLVFLALMFVGGSSGSTAGGMKLMRAALATKQIRRELARLSHPHGVVPIHYAERTVAEPALHGLWSFLVLLFAAFAALAVALSALGFDAAGAVKMSVLTLTNSGAGLALVVGAEASYAVLPDPTKWLLCLGMLLGRLELVIALVLLTPAFWRR